MGKLIGIAALFVALTTPAMAGTEKFASVYQEVEYDFDGIKGSLDIGLYNDQNNLVGMIGFTCSKEDNSVTIIHSYEKKFPKPVADDFRKGWVSIDGRKMMTLLQIRKEYILAVFTPKDHISELVKALYNGVDEGSKIGIFDNEVAFIRTGRDQFIELGNPPHTEITLSSTFKVHGDTSTGRAKKEFGQFYQLCSIWWD